MKLSFVKWDYSYGNTNLISGDIGIFLPPHIESVRFYTKDGDEALVDGAIDRIAARLRDEGYAVAILESYDGCPLTARGRRIYDWLDDRNFGVGQGPRVMKIDEGPLFEIAINPIEGLNDIADWDEVGPDLLGIDWSDGLETADGLEFVGRFHYAFDSRSFNTADILANGSLSMWDRISEEKVKIELFRIEKVKCAPRSSVT